ncbi:MAG: ribonuclease III [Fusobacteriota bacterium]
MLEKKIGYKFKNKDILKKALIHRSYGNENPRYKNVDNERLELLGDAVLDLVVTEYIFKNYKEASEGELAKLKAMIVSEPVLAEVSSEIDLGKYLLLSKGEEKTGGRNRTSILGDAFEALLGAIYIDSDLKNAKKFVLKFLKYKIEHIEENEKLIDYKTILQEYIQQKYKKLPNYVVLNEKGPDHNKVFEIGVKLNGKILAKGNGRNKKNAEQNAAKKSCENMEIDINELL